MTADLRDLVLGDGFWLSGMLGIFAWFGKISVELFDHGVLVAVAELAPHAVVARLFRVIRFECSLLPILVPMLVHE